MKTPPGWIRFRHFSNALLGWFVYTALLTLAGKAGAADWLQWRGPNRDGISIEKNGVAANPKPLWKANVGTGCSSFSVVGGQVFTMGNDKDTGSVYCLDAASGKILWQHSYPSPLEPLMFEGGQCSTPTVEGDSVFALGRQGQFFCLNRATGAVVWSKDLPKDFSVASLAKWGYAGSPLVLGNKVIIEVGARGASAVALDKTNGTVLWQCGDDAQSYGSPYAFMQDGKQCVAFFNAFGLVVRDAADGREVMRYPWKTSYDVNPTTPIVADGKIFIASGYGHGAALLPLGVAVPKPIWESKEMKNHMNSCVLWQGYLYGFDESALTCMEFATGTVKWQQKGLGKGALILADGKLIIQAEDGALAIAEASPEAYKELSRTPAVAKRSWVIPVLANGRIYTRNNNGEVACFDVSGK
ncbi:MAG: PQQ-binding-like beta-propeller repeat protein [Verrucomicrobiota bacterium]